MAKRRPKLLKETKDLAMLIAMYVRNSMEDFHVDHLSDEQMKELNPIIRNAVCTALYATRNYSEDEACRKFVNIQAMFIPNYWEEPELTEEFIRFTKYIRRRKEENQN